MTTKFIKVPNKNHLSFVKADDISEIVVKETDVTFYLGTNSASQINIEFEDQRKAEAYVTRLMNKLGFEIIE